MDVEIWVAIIAAVASVVGVVIASVCTTRKANADILTNLEASQQATNIKIEQLTKEVEKHNQVVERTYKLEGRVTALEERMDDMKGSRK